MLFSVEQAFVGREEIRAPLELPACEQGCCLTGARSPEAPKVRAWATKFRYKEPARAPDLTHGIRLNLLVHYIPLAGVGL